MTNCLIYDFKVRNEGHNLGFIQNIYQYLLHKKTLDTQYVFLLNPQAKDYFTNAENHPQIKIVFITEQEYYKAESAKTTLKSAEIHWEIIQLYAEKYAIHHLILMELDIFQVEIGRNRNIPFTISGIYFRPYQRIAASSTDSLSERFLLKIKLAKKKLALRYMLKNNKLTKVFVFNDTETIALLNKRYKPVFYLLPDPIFQSPVDNTISIRKQYGIASDHKIVLIFGVIDERKNALNIIEALQAMPHSTLSTLTLMVVGTVAESYKEQLQQAAQLATGLQTIVIDRFVNNTEMEAIFQQSDLIMVTYIDFYVSSGVLGNAAKYNKPMVGSNYGLIGYQIQAFNMGKVVDPLDVQQLQHAMLTLLNDQNFKFTSQANDFVKVNSPEAFVEKLLEF
ncbi:MAG: hypothetical protein RL311_1339 [Bacteroidota bacterium]|jgi:glycosyltransferase involved in cell wall biosynthesis